jgi:hypothetical protein
LSLLGNWQDVRWLGAIGIALAIADALPPSQRRRWAFRWLLLLNTLNALVSLYQIWAGDYTTTRLGIPVVTGLFGQVTANALAATLLLIFVLAERRANPPSMTTREMHFALAVGLLDLLLSTRFKPALALGAVAAFVLIRQMGVGPVALALAAALVPVTITLAFASAIPSRGTQDESGVTGTIVAHAIPRVQFMDGAERLASAHFPLGGGSGSYGADLNQSRETETFTEAGLATRYGFRAQGPRFNSDNFVAHVLGERGYIGLVAWLLSLAALIYFAAVSPSSGFVFCVAIVAVVLTPVLPVFRDSASALLLFVPAVLCLRLSTSPSGPYDSRQRGDVLP